MQRGQVYRSEEVGIAYDEWYSELPKDARLLWYTLKNSRDMTACGLVKVAMGTICFETAMTRAEVLAAIEAISQPFKSNSGDDYSRVVYWPRYDVFWVRNFYRKQRANSNTTNFDISARKSLAQFPEEIRRCVADVYPTLAEPTPHPMDTHTDGIPNPSPSHPNPIEQQEAVNSKQLTVLSTEVDKRERAPAPPKPTGKSKGTLIPQDFDVGDDLQRWAADKAAEHSVYLNVRLMAEQFLAWFRTGDGKNTPHVSWSATWQQWVLREIKLGGHKNGQSQSTTGLSNGTAKARSTERAIGEEAQYRARRQARGDYHEGEVGSRPTAT